MHKFDFLSSILLGVSLIIISLSLVMSWHQNFITFKPTHSRSLDVQTVNAVNFNQTKTAQRLIVSQLLLSDQLGHDMSTSFVSAAKNEDEKIKVRIVNKTGGDILIDDAGALISSASNLSILRDNNQWTIEVAHD